MGTFECFKVVKYTEDGAIVSTKWISEQFCLREVKTTATESTGGGRQFAFALGAQSMELESYSLAEGS